MTDMSEEKKFKVWAICAFKNPMFGTLFEIPICHMRVNPIGFKDEIIRPWAIFGTRKEALYAKKLSAKTMKATKVIKIEVAL